MKLPLTIFSILSIIMMPSCEQSEPTISQIFPGVEKSMADHRKKYIEKLKYKLHFDIPDSQAQPITGSVDISLELNNDKNDLVLDFKQQAESVKMVKLAGKEIEHQWSNGHLIIPNHYLKNGNIQINIKFIAGEQALNRNPDFLYTLFVPDKASSAFPCFDQPNMKATYELSLEIPKHWTTVTNYPLVKKVETDDRVLYEFASTLPISTYLFAFAAGEFKTVTKIQDGREMTLYHRETNAEKIERNAPEVFDLHAKSIAWLEEYTGIAMPFKKFDFVLIPAFQFGGMEHPGAIFYKSRSLFLEENATVNQKLSRNSLIAHETAHMWFGDLVTMDWFNDVWLKEVFANFMAAKMVNPNFPEINHRLRFLQRHQPAAYSEDRTSGTHPIQQKLDNLDEASLMYGRIIYQKAPVVMNQLEKMMGPEIFQEGLQEYLKTYSFDNATWDDLISILDKRTTIDLNNWSQAWVKESGLPHIKASLTSQNKKITAYQLSFENLTSGGNIWKQNTQIISSKNGQVNVIPYLLNEKENLVSKLKGEEEPDFILANASEIAYGFFELDSKSLYYLLNNIHLIEDDLIKSAAWLSLWEGMLQGSVPTRRLMQSLLIGLPYEKEILGLSSRLDYLSTIYWGFIDVEVRQRIYNTLGEILWRKMENEPSKDRKKIYFDTFVSVAQSEEDISKILELWEMKRTINGLTLTEDEYTTLAYELAVREIPECENILRQQLERISNPDRKAAMSFIIPALSKNQIERDSFFEKLKSPENRQKEPWVLKALQYLQHPLRADSSEKYILPSLELVREIQKTNGIFFPKRWTSTILNGHRSEAAAIIVNEFISQLSEDYPYKLKNKILQSADLLYRKASLSKKQN